MLNTQFLKTIGKTMEDVHAAVEGSDVDLDFIMESSNRLDNGEVLPTEEGKRLERELKELTKLLVPEDIYNKMLTVHERIKSLRAEVEEIDKLGEITGVRVQLIIYNQYDEDSVPMPTGRAKDITLQYVNAISDAIRYALGGQEIPEKMDEEFNMTALLGKELAAIRQLSRMISES